jgi:GT2 family glycosyltransferase
VTGACLMVRREVFNEVGGLDERLFVTFNDVDFCLRVRKAGYRNIWTPFAELVHHESASRGQDDTPEKQARFLREVSFMRERWGALLDHDPFYHPLFSPLAASFVVSPRPSTAGIRNAA